MMAETQMLVARKIFSIAVGYESQCEISESHILFIDNKNLYGVGKAKMIVETGHVYLEKTNAPKMNRSTKYFVDKVDKQTSTMQLSGSLGMVILKGTAWL